MTLVTFRQMVAAELLKLRRKHSVIALAAFFSVGVLALYFGVSAIEHASNPASYGPAGGLHNFDRATVILSVFFGALSAILIGTEAGTADLSSGVFRDLVVTGRSRLWMFGVRVAGALIVTLALALCGLGVSLFVAYLFAGGLPTPSATFAIDSVLWVCGAQALVCVIAVGLGSLTGSRAVSLTTLIGWTVIASRLLPTIGFLGNARYAIPNIALGGLKPGDPLPDANGIIPGAAASMAVLAAWVVVWLAVGAWRTNTQDA
jgi:hypothetical protein